MRHSVIKTESKVLIMNVLCPVLIGALFYYLTSPDVIFVKYIDAVIGSRLHFRLFSMDNVFGKFIRNYFLDMLWAYALVFALFFILGNNTVFLWKTFGTAFSFSAVMEILQLAPAVMGTFDVLDIGVECLAEIIAVIIIKKYNLGGS